MLEATVPRAAVAGFVEARGPGRASFGRNVALSVVRSF